MPLTVDALESVAAGRPGSAAIPHPVAQLLRTTRALFVDSWLHYKFLTVAVAWSLIAVEAALRNVHPGRGRDPLKALHRRAHSAGA